ncbi:MAG: NERD domain-containing protein [Alphaproteobacteria bacterium]|nr:NERD domain-containing protein [Alphaproteobacteria bacterium]
MAIMIPEVADPEQIRPHSEGKVYRALKEQLSSDFIVFHSFPWLRRWRGNADKALVEGEADFVILHPERGLLVLEVKGGDIYLEGPRWMRLEETGPVELRDPFEQARRNMHALLDIVADWLRDNGEQLALKGRHAALSYGYAVFFPEKNYTGPPPANADRAIILSHRHVHDVSDAISVAYRAWEDAPRPLGHAALNLLYRALTARPVFVSPVGARIPEERERLHLLTETQTRAYQALLRGRPRVLIQGPAGSGKTEIAFARAAELACEGRRVLLTCFNKELAIWLRERAEADESLQAASGSLVVEHFHSLAKELAIHAGLAWDPRSSSDFWTEQVYDIILTAAQRLESSGTWTRYDAILLDEAQDFHGAWWWALAEELLVKDEGAPLYAFMDPKQKLRADASIPADFDMGSPVCIRENCRNTQRIATVGARTVELEPSFLPHAPQGAQVRILWAGRSDRQRRYVEDELTRLGETHSLKQGQVALVGPSTRVGSLAGTDTLGGFPLTRSPAAWRRGEGALVTTARSFKGLEADAVVVYDLGGLGEHFTLEDLYVACTRPRFHLTVICHGDRALFADLQRWAK